MAAIAFELPDQMKREIERTARKDKISVSEYVRRAVAVYLGHNTRYLTYDEILELINSELDKRLLVKQSEKPIAGDDKMVRVLEIIYNELVAGNEPTVQEISAKVDMDLRQMGILLKQLYNIESHNVRRGGKKGRRYLIEDLDKIKQILYK